MHNTSPVNTPPSRCWRLRAFMSWQHYSRGYIRPEAELFMRQLVKCDGMQGNAVPPPLIQRSHISDFIKTLEDPQPPVGGSWCAVLSPLIFFTLTASYDKISDSDRSVNPISVTQNITYVIIIIIRITTTFVKRKKWTSDALHRRAGIESFQFLRKCLNWAGRQSQSCWQTVPNGCGRNCKVSVKYILLIE